MIITELTKDSSTQKELNLSSNKAEIEKFASLGFLDAKKEIAKDEIAKASSIEEKLDSILKFLGL